MAKRTPNFRNDICVALCLDQERLETISDADIVEMVSLYTRDSQRLRSGDYVRNEKTVSVAARLVGGRRG
jgi:hypothetical protein